jgi:hypothetical protein
MSLANEARGSQHTHTISALLAALIVHNDLERDSLSLIQFVGVCDVARMDKNIAAAAVRPNKAEASIILETDNNTLCHIFIRFCSFRLSGDRPRRAKSGQGCSAIDHDANFIEAEAKHKPPIDMVGDDVVETFKQRTVPAASQRRIPRIGFERGGERFAGHISGTPRVFTVEHRLNEMRARATTRPA